MVYLIVDNRASEDVAHWPAFAQWWSSRRALIGPQQERTDVVWIQATQSTGLREVPYYWAGVFVLEVARFLFPTVHLGLIDNDCVPVTLFEVPELVALAKNQFHWSDLVGHQGNANAEDNKVGMLLFTEAHLEYNAGLVISIGSTTRPSPVTGTSTPTSLSEELEDYRQQLLAMATPPEHPTDTSQGGSLFTPLVGVPMETSLDLVVVWALYGIYMCHQFWPMPTRLHEREAVKWPRRAHPGALSAAGQERTPWLTSWARATFEQGCLSVLPHMEGSCKAVSLPGEHLFQASRIRHDRMRPAIFHAFGKAKEDAPAQLARLACQGWETLPIVVLGMPHHPAAWSTDDWKPIGGCCFTGSPPALQGNSACRFCLLCQWHTIWVPSTELFQATSVDSDPELEPTDVALETQAELLTRTLLDAAVDPNSRESGLSSVPVSVPVSSTAQWPSQATGHCPPDPQQLNPPLFVSWQAITQQVGIPQEHELPSENLHSLFQQAIGILHTTEQRDFHSIYGSAFSTIPAVFAPIETVAPTVLQSMYATKAWTPYWETIVWQLAQSCGFWLVAPDPPPPCHIQINCGGLGGGSLPSPTAPTFHCTHPRVNGTCVYGPSLSPADRYTGQVTQVAAGHTTSLHELAMLMIHTKDPCEAWEHLGGGRAAKLYRRTQVVLEASRPGQYDIHLIHAEDDVLCNWHPSRSDRHTLSYRLKCTIVAGSDKWMGADKHSYWHWLHCNLPNGRWLLSELKLSHPDVIPIRDRMAAPLRLASWIRFETAMDQKEWRAAIERLVPRIHLPDPELLELLRTCVPEQQISSMAEAQALLLRNFRVGGSQPSECAKWLTIVTRALFEPIPFRGSSSSCPCSCRN